VRLPTNICLPQPGPQKALIDCELGEVFFGGARGGGKTYGALLKMGLNALRYGEGFNAIFFRQSTTQLEDAIEVSKSIYPALGGTFTSQPPRWRFANGARISWGFLDSVDDADVWQGRSLTAAIVEEAGLYASPDPILRLNGVLRSATGIPTQLILTANPGGPGQGWLRDRYNLHPFPSEPQILTRELPNGSDWNAAVIPSRIQDNKILLDADPDYINRLYQVGSTELVRAWLEGDWSAIESAFFDCWKENKHVIRPIPMGEMVQWLKFRSADWGSAAPFSIGWWAVVTDDYTAENLAGAPVRLPRGCMVRYREWYGAKAPNVGLKLVAEDVANGIVSREKGDKLQYGVLDPSTFKEDGGPSVGERINGILSKAGMPAFRHADNTRVGKAGAMSGWDQMRARMKGDAIDQDPMVVAFSTCTDSIRTIPMLQHDRARAEDLDTKAEDHAADEWRYGCSSRPWVPTTATTKPKKPNDYKFKSQREDLAMSIKVM
jgi:hypothetical protein